VDTYALTKENRVNIRTIAGIAILLAGLAALYFGMQESSSLASEVSEAFTGSPTDRSMQLMIGGGIGVVVGLLLALTGRGK
jgi:hypothetical protein